MENKNIEVEIRGPMSNNEYAKTIEYLNKHGQFKGNKNRVLIDLSGSLNQPIENRTVDFRIRNTNKKSEIVIKKGLWGGSDQREEIIITTDSSFDDLVKLCKAINLNKGVLCIRNMAIYEYQDIEFALVEVPNHSYYFEAEKVIKDSSEADKARETIKQVCDQLNLTMFDDQGYFSYIAQLNTEANKALDLNNIPEDFFKKSFSI